MPQPSAPNSKTRRPPIRRHMRTPGVYDRSHGTRSGPVHTPIAPPPPPTPAPQPPGGTRRAAPGAASPWPLSMALPPPAQSHVPPKRTTTSGLSAALLARRQWGDQQLRRAASRRGRVPGSASRVNATAIHIPTLPPPNTTPPAQATEPPPSRGVPGTKNGERGGHPGGNRGTLCPAHARRAHVPSLPPPCPLCDSPSGCCSFTGPWTVTRSPLRMLRRVAAFCRPLRPVLLLVSFPRSRRPVVGVPGLC